MPWLSSLRWTLVRLMPVSHSQVAIQIIRYGLNQDVRVSQKEARANELGSNLINTDLHVIISGVS